MGRCDCERGIAQELLNKPGMALPSKLSDVESILPLEPVNNNNNNNNNNNSNNNNMIMICVIPKKGL